MKYKLLTNSKSIVFLILISVIFSSCMESIAPKKVVEVGAIIPEYQGCTSGVALDISKILIKYEYPSWATEVYVYRDGQEVFKINKDRGTSSNLYIDSDLIEGHEYIYQCLAKYEYVDKRNDKQEEIVKGDNILEVATKSVNKPNFGGIKSVDVVSANEAIVNWETPKEGGAEVSYYT